MRPHMVMGPFAVRSSTKVRSVELRNHQFVRQGAPLLASSTKVRSVELRNITNDIYDVTQGRPQRKCEAWSFAIIVVFTSLSMPR